MPSKWEQFDQWQQDADVDTSHPQHSVGGGPWIDGYPPRIGKPGTRVYLRYKERPIKTESENKN